jgi:dTDP-4-amino-4,6-dideoxygalactose transaminase
VIKARHRNELQKFLKDQGIETALHYPTPLPFLEAYNYLHYRPSDLPVSYAYKDQILSLPLYPELGHAQIKYIAESIAKFYSMARINRRFYKEVL